MYKYIYIFFFEVCIHKFIYIYIYVCIYIYRCMYIYINIYIMLTTPTTSIPTRGPS